MEVSFAFAGLLSANVVRPAYRIDAGDFEDLLGAIDAADREARDRRPG